MTSTTDLLDEAIAYHEAGRLDDAEALYRQILELDPNDADALHLLGAAAQQRGQHNEALDLVRRAIAEDDEIPEFHNTLGEALRASGQLAEAGDAYARALALHPRFPEALNNLGLVRYRQKELEVSVALFESALQLTPEAPQVLQNLGNALFDLGLSEAAARVYERALAAAPDNALLHAHLGIARHALGDYKSAAAALEAALALEPELVLAMRQLAAVAQAQEDPEHACSLLRKALDIEPDNAELHRGLGFALNSLARREEAAEAYRRALALDDTVAGAWLEYGTVQRMSGDMRSAIDCYRRAAELDPQLAPAQLLLGVTLQRRGRDAEAAVALRKAIAIEPERAQSHVDLAVSLHELGEYDEALASCERALELDPECAAAHCALARLQRRRGDVADARASNERALAIDAELLWAYMQLAELRKVEPGDLAFEILEAMRGRPDLGLEDQATLHFVLGKMYADIGAHDDAFAAYHTGNQLVARGARVLGEHFDIEMQRRSVDDLIAGYVPQRFAEHHGFGLPSEVPIFIVGMPRSGSTLVEQILTSHPDIDGVGERSWLIDLSRSVADSERLSRATARRLAREYLERLTQHAGGALRVTDKTLANFHNLGLVALILPNARVVHCRRSPVDTCLSCYFLHFTHGQSFAYDLSELGRYYSEYRRLMDHWREVLPRPMFEIDYEELIADQEGVSRALIEYCGLPWDDRCLDFHDNPRPVATASGVQVRQRIYASSIERWRPYEHHLGELREALGPYWPARADQA